MRAVGIDLAKNGLPRGKEMLSWSPDFGGAETEAVAPYLNPLPGVQEALTYNSTKAHSTQQYPSLDTSIVGIDVGIDVGKGCICDGYSQCVIAAKRINNRPSPMPGYLDTVQQQQVPPQKHYLKAPPYIG